jgi:hypothetical protein
MTKLLLLSLIFLFSSLIAFTQTQNWFPLNIDNKWQFLDYEYFEAHGDGTSNVYLRTYSVDRDTMIGSTKYFSYDGQWMRYNNNRIYIWNNGADSLFMDFDLPAGTHINSFFEGQSFSAITTEETISFLGKEVPYKGFQSSDMNSLGFINTSTIFINDFGLANYDYYLDDVIYTSHTETSFILSLIKDSVGNIVCTKENVKPDIITNPILYAASSAFSWVANVTHSYSLYSLNFIETVHFKSFYSFRDSLFTDSSTVIVPPGISNYYFPTAVLDTNLLKKGWIFKYNLTAIDKCLVPDSAFSPNTGYYSCQWAGPTLINDKNISPSYYSLFQNYPNPFNPETIINYSLAKSGRAKITVYDLIGRQVAILINENKPEGSYSVKFTAGNLPSGVYFYKLESGNYSAIKKLVLIK